MPDVLMPRLSDSMETGTIARWLRVDGDEVARGEEIAEIETDKATMAYEADHAGVLLTVAAEGEALPVGAVIARIGESAPVGEPAPTGSRMPVAASAPAARAGGGASPVARRSAAALGLPLDGVTGSGPHGRVLKADVLAAANGGAAPAATGAPTSAASIPTAAARPAQANAPAPAGAKGGTTVAELSRLQQVVARRMAESKATVPDFALEVDVDMTAAVALREQLRGAVDPLPSFNDLLVKACGVVLRRHPRVNGSYRDGRFETYARVNVGVAVAGDDALVVPVVTDADARSLSAIAAETRRLAARVRDGSITPPSSRAGRSRSPTSGCSGSTASPARSISRRRRSSASARSLGVRRSGGTAR